MGSDKRGKKVSGLKKGGCFTLIELLVVVAIISMLVAMLLPALESVTSRARIIKCLSNTRQMYTGCFVYSGDYDGWFPTPSWGVRVAPYVGCDKTVSAYPWASNAVYKVIRIFQCPETIDWPKVSNWNQLCYGYNWPLTSGTRPELVRNSTRIEYPSRTILIFDCVLNPQNWRELDAYSASTPEELGRTDNGLARHHDMTVNFAFTDGHAKNLRGGERTDLVFWVQKTPSSTALGWTGLEYP